MSRFTEYVLGRQKRPIPLFTGTRRHIHSVLVRGDQIAKELGGACLRSRFLRPEAVEASTALVWIEQPDLELVERFKWLTPQIAEPVNPKEDPSFNRELRAFAFLLLNTNSSVDYLGPAPEHGWKHWVIPHHHCNTSGYRLPEARIEAPRVVGYVGEPQHLHDFEAIQRAVEKLGLKFMNASSVELDAYREIDIGVAWTRRESKRDAMRSNIKLANFSSHGIPAVVCPYESYLDEDTALGGGSCLIRASLADFVDGLAELATNLDLRREVHGRALPAYEMYSRSTIGRQYRRMFDEANSLFLQRCEAQRRQAVR